MQFSVKREVFNKGLKFLAGVIERRQSNFLPILANVLIRVEGETAHFLGTDQEVELSTSIPVEDVKLAGSLTVPYRKLVEITRACSDNSLLKIKAANNKITIKNNNSNFNLATLPASEFPLILNNEDNISFTLSHTDLRKLIVNCSFAMADQDVRSYFNGMLLEYRKGQLTAVAADGHRMARAQMPFDDQELNNFSVIIPRKGIIEILRVVDESEQALQIFINKRFLKIKMHDLEFTTKLLEGNFPEYQSLIPKNNLMPMTVSRQVLKDAYLRAMALFTDKSSTIKMVLSTNNLQLLATNNEQDEVEENVSIEYSGENLEINFNVKYLLDFLNISSGNQVCFKFVNAMNSVLIENLEDDSFVYIVMPRRV